MLETIRVFQSVAIGNRGARVRWWSFPPRALCWPSVSAREWALFFSDAHTDRGLHCSVCCSIGKGVLRRKSSVSSPEHFRTRLIVGGAYGMRPHLGSRPPILRGSCRLFGRGDMTGVPAGFETAGRRTVEMASPSRAFAMNCWGRANVLARRSSRSNELLTKNELTARPPRLQACMRGWQPPISIACKKKGCAPGGGSPSKQDLCFRFSESR
jgi:hypothetical protein